MASTLPSPAHTFKPRSCRSRASSAESAVACDHTTFSESERKRQRQKVRKTKLRPQVTTGRLEVKSPPKTSKTTRCIFAKSAWGHRNRNFIWISIPGLRIFGYAERSRALAIDAKLYRSGLLSFPKTSSVQPIHRTSRSLSIPPSQARSRSSMARRGRSRMATRRQQAVM
jgi:hypothetical protein